VYPTLFRIGDVTFYSYGVAIAVALLAATLVAGSLLKRHGRAPGLAVELALAAAAGGFAGARLYWLAEHWSTVREDLLHGLVAGAGFTWYGGLLGGLVAVAAWATWRGLPLGFVANVTAPALALGYGLGRVACQLAGDGTYGTPSDLPWAMAYPGGTTPTAVAVHPTPVYETLAMLLVFALLFRLASRPQPGWLVFAWFLVLSGLERFAVEFLRLNTQGLLGLTQPQWFALASLVAGLTLVVARRALGTPTA
jgi:phosphatidylglycerol:prolipoprotein diacylglycerol transferase